MKTRGCEPESPGPLKYAPKSARMVALETERGSEPRLASVRPPERRPPPPQHGKPAPPRKLTMQEGSFAGDVAVKDLRERMARAPDLPPKPPVRNDGGSAFGMVGRLVILVTTAAIAAYGFIWTSKPRDLDNGFTLAAYGKSAADEEPGAAPVLNNTGVNAAGSNGGSFRTAVFQFPPVPAAVLKADMMPRDEAPSADRPQVLATVRWPAPDAGRDLANLPREGKTDDVVVPAPANTASLRHSPPAEAETQTAPPVSTAPRINDDDMANLLAIGRTFLIIGDVTAARMAFRRAAESGDAQAAFALGGTFDPLVLKSLGAVGVAADPAQARGWYQKAAELGSRDAPHRLNELAQSVR